MGTLAGAAVALAPLLALALIPLLLPDATAFKLPVLMVDFSVEVAANARR